MHQIQTRSTNLHTAHVFFSETCSFNIILIECTYIVANRGRGNRFQRGLDPNKLVEQIGMVLTTGIATAGSILGGGGGGGGVLGGLGGLGGLISLAGRKWNNHQKYLTFKI